MYSFLSSLTICVAFAKIQEQFMVCVYYEVLVPLAVILSYQVNSGKREGSTLQHRPQNSNNNEIHITYIHTNAVTFYSFKISMMKRKRG